MKKRAVAVCLLAALIISLVPGRVQALSSSEIQKQIDELKDKNEELEAQKEEIQSQYEANENEILDMVARKNVIDQEISLLHAQIANINDQIAAFSLLIADKQDELDEAQLRYRELNEKNKERIRTMEEEGTLSYWSVLFEANSFSDLLDRIEMIQEIAAADKRRLQELSDAAQAVADAQSALEADKAALEQTRAELDEKQAELEAKRQEADELLNQLIAKGEEFEQLLEESEALQEELMQEIAEKNVELEDAKYQEWLATSVTTTAPTTPTATTPANPGTTEPSVDAPSSSGWLCPIQDGYTLSSPFGMRMHPILGYERMHNGVDMACPQDTAIYAARSGYVTTASYQANGAGNYVSISHGDGFSSIYMHMHYYVVSAGDYVEQGQIIGYVGNTGLSKGNHLHFGISYNGTYVNPMDYIS